jgi:trehalose 6-phosphate phosphatase
MSTQQPFTAPDPRNFPTRRTCLFLGVDGTLVDFAMRPDEVRIDPGLIQVLGTVQRQLGGAVALISGRPLRELDALFAPLVLPAAGVHGAERRSLVDGLHSTALPRRRLGSARTLLQQITAAHPGLILEDKDNGFALHYRQAPELGDVARGAIHRAAHKLGSGFEVLQGDLAVELKPSAWNKATAVEAFLDEEPFAGRIPIYLGDDGTDHEGFSAVKRRRGVDIVVGNRIPARWSLDNPAAVRAWLERFAEQGLPSR